MKIDVLVIGGGPAGMTAAATAAQQGKKTLLLERENRIGGILKQCIHDGFGVVKYNERLTGPEYAAKEAETLGESGAEVVTGAFVTRIVKLGNEDSDEGFEVDYVCAEGVCSLKAQRIVLATGCRERTAKQIFIGGTSPSGVMTAGTAQHYINMMGLVPTKRCVILGSGDIGLIMARRLTLEGAVVEGVYEVKPTPGGLTRNIVQCLEDFSIPLHLRHTVTRVFGEDRLTGVEVAEIDEEGKVIEKTRRKVDCDALILSVGLIPENEIAVKLNVPIDGKTKGPYVDQTFMTGVRGVYACGNCLHVNDLADYVSESGFMAGGYASSEMYPINYVEVKADDKLGYVVPQLINADAPHKVIFYFRVKRELKNQSISIWVNGERVGLKHFASLKPPEMERWEINLPKELKCVEIKVEENAIKISAGEEAE